ncbi:hypothetical protein GLOIN_2v1869233 [Rhizophagus clarus]|nr:hypothetical protein GLOIN_2v1869233 [Rhizophagus clarus]
MTNTFVSSHFYGELLFGLSHDVWHFTTLVNEQEESQINKIKGEIQRFLYDINGQVRLTQEGTVFFDGLSRDQRIEFFKNLTQEITDALPVTPGRITTSWKFQIDTSLPNDQKQYLLSINIKKANHPTDRKVDLTAKDLNFMIKNMAITTLASGYSSKYLDQSYGYDRFPSWIDENRNKIIITAAGIVFLTLLVLLSILHDEDRRDKNVLGVFFSSLKSSIFNKNQGNDDNKIDHFKIYKYGRIIASFVTDILFASIDSKSIQNIFYVSVFFIIFPYLVKLMFCIRFILEEIGPKVAPSLSISPDNVSVQVDLKDNPNNLDNEDSKEVPNNSNNELNAVQINPKNEESKEVSIKDWLTNENDSSKNKNKIRKIVFTAIIIIAGVDFAALDILESNLGIKRFKLKFNAKKSKNSEDIISKGELISTLIKEIPEVITKGYLLSQVVKFSYLTVLTLIFSIFSVLKLFIKLLREML